MRREGGGGGGRINNLRTERNIDIAGIERRNILVTGDFEKRAAGAS